MSIECIYSFLFFGREGGRGYRLFFSLYICEGGGVGTLMCMDGEDGGRLKKRGGVGSAHMREGGSKCRLLCIYLC